MQEHKEGPPRIGSSNLNVAIVYGAALLVLFALALLLLSRFASTPASTAPSISPTAAQATPSVAPTSIAGSIRTAIPPSFATPALATPALATPSIIDSVAAVNVQRDDPVGTRVPADPATHVPEGQKVTTYSTDPPTSGLHWSSTASWGIKDAEEPNERIVHNLEHGGIIISYRALTQDELTDLTIVVGALNKSGYRKILVRPYSQLKDSKIVLAAWGWMSKFTQVDANGIISFVKAHHSGSDAPEPNVP